MQPDISIITPWLDHPQFIADFEKAVSAVGVEVIVVDNGSTRTNSLALQEMIGRLKGKYLRNEENRWFAAANNQGLAVAGGKIILFLNNDVSGDPIWIDAVRKDVASGALYGPKLLSIDVDGRTIPYHEGWCIAAAREDWDRLGGWDAREHSMPYWEDNDLGFRAAGLGLKLIQTNWPIHHKGQGTSIDVPGVRFGFERLRERFLAQVRGQKNASALQGLPEAPTTFEQAVELHQRGFLPEAERAYQAALAGTPQNGDIWAGYGEVLYLSGRHEAAAAALEKAVELMPGSAEHWTNFGTVLGRARQHANAVAALQRAVDLAPESAAARCNLSRALFRCGQYEQAADAARAALELQPGFIVALVNLSNALRASKNLQEALEAATTAVQLKPNSTLATNALGAALRAMGRLAEAQHAFRRAMQITPNDSIAQRNLKELSATI